MANKQQKIVDILNRNGGTVDSVVSGTNITVDATDPANPIVSGLSDAQIKTAYENNANTNAFTDADETKLGNVESNAKDDQNADEVPYDNSSTDLIATEVQAAIDEVLALALGGSAAIAPYTFSSSTTSSDPSAGNFRLNNGTQSSSTALYIDNLDGDNVDRSNGILTIPIGTVFMIRSGRDTSRWHQIRTTGIPVNNTGWFTIPIIVLNSGNDLQNNKLCLISSITIEQTYSISIEATITTSSNTPVLATGMTVTPVAGKYLCIFNTTVSNSATNGAVYIMYRFDGVIDFVSLRLLANGGTTTTGNLNTQAVYTFNGSQTLDVYWTDYNVGAGICTMFQKILTLIRIG